MLFHGFIALCCVLFAVVVAQLCCTLTWGDEPNENNFDNT